MKNDLPNSFAAEPNSPLRFGAIALGQQAGMRFTPLTQIALSGNFAYPPDVIGNCMPHD